MQALAIRFRAIFIFSLTSLLSYSQQWEQVGKAGEWGTTTDVIAMTASDGFIWSVENGTLFRTKG
jgi:hypothetical protein